MTEGKKVLVRSGGDLASAVIQKLHRCGFEIVVCELENPKMVRRTVSFSNAVYEGSYEVEGIKAVHVKDVSEISLYLKENLIPVVTDLESKILEVYHPDIFIDATLSKKKVTYNKDYMPIIIGLGPEINAGIDADIVIETCRGHDLGRLIFNGFAKVNTSIPGFIDGYGKERVLRAPCDGQINTYKKIGDMVEKDETIMTVNDMPVKSQIKGVIRGLIHPSVLVTKGLKIGDVDPRGSRAYCFSISDKGRNIAGGVLEAILMLLKSDK
jgi:xanthine dehydrogenase accessory factor